MRLNPRTITSAYAVHGQLQPEDMSEVCALGYSSIINNRPDGEEPGQPESLVLAKAANAVGLQYVHIPVTGPVTDLQRDAMRQALASLTPPVLGFCRSGARSVHIWELAMNGLNDDDLGALT